MKTNTAPGEAPATSKPAAIGVDAVAQILEDKPFLFGDVPTAADATAVPMLRAQAFFPRDNPMSNLVLKKGPLMAYLDRGAEALYP